MAVIVLNQQNRGSRDPVLPPLSLTIQISLFIVYFTSPGLAIKLFNLHVVHKGEAAGCIFYRDTEVDKTLEGSMGRWVEALSGSTCSKGSFWP